MRRVAPPQAGATRLITVQIEPRSVEAEPETAETTIEGLDAALAGLEPLGSIEPGNGTDPGSREWLWKRLPHDQTQGRLAQAAAMLGAPAGGSGDAASRARIKEISRQYGAEIAQASRNANVSPALVLAVIHVESAGRHEAVSHAGAGGLMQLMPATATRFGVQDRFDPGQNIRGGVAYLDWLLREFRGDAILALAGYNAGENAVIRHGGVPPYAETRDYVPKVVAAWRLASELCNSAQTTARDICSWDDLALNVH